MLRRKTISFLALTLLLIGCSLQGEENQREVISVPADSVAVLEVSRESVAFHFEGTLPVPCYEFEGLQRNRYGDSIAVTVRAQRTATYCVTAIGRLRKSPLTIPVLDDGRKTFSFWRDEEQQPLTLEVPIP